MPPALCDVVPGSDPSPATLLERGAWFDAVRGEDRYVHVRGRYDGWRAATHLLSHKFGVDFIQGLYLLVRGAEGRFLYDVTCGAYHPVPTWCVPKPGPFPTHLIKFEVHGTSHVSHLAFTARSPLQVVCVPLELTALGQEIVFSTYDCVVFRNGRHYIQLMADGRSRALPEPHDPDVVDSFLLIDGYGRACWLYKRRLETKWFAREYDLWSGELRGDPVLFCTGGLCDFSYPQYRWWGVHAQLHTFCWRCLNKPGSKVHRKCGDKCCGSLTCVVGGPARSVFAEGGRIRLHTYLGGVATVEDWRLRVPATVLRPPSGRRGVQTWGGGRWVGINPREFGEGGFELVLRMRGWGELPLPLFAPWVQRVAGVLRALGAAASMGRVYWGLE